jgi:hypothetical protein
MRFEWVAGRVLGNVPIPQAAHPTGRGPRGYVGIVDHDASVTLHVTWIAAVAPQVYYPAAHLTVSRLPLSHTPDVCTAQRAMTKDQTEWPKDTLRHAFSSHLRLSSCDSSGRLKIERFRTRRRLIRVLIADTGTSNLSGPVRKAPRSGRGGRRFKSCHSDQLIKHLADPEKIAPKKLPKKPGREAEGNAVGYLS